jgi:acetyltransferase-like isoleucine patch superfamily enzyme
MKFVMLRVKAICGRYGWRTPFVVSMTLISNLGGLWNLIRVLRVKLLTLGTKGKSLILGRNISFNFGGLIRIGDFCYIGDRVVIEVGINPPAKLQIGSHAWITHDVHIAAAGCVTIGNHVLIGEYTSIRDSLHSCSDVSLPIKFQRDTVGTVEIHDDVWIGRGCIVLGRPEGIVVGRGAIVGANSVVCKSIPAMEIWGGVPAKFLRSRTRMESFGTGANTNRR